MAIMQQKNAAPMEISFAWKLNEEIAFSTASVTICDQELYLRHSFHHSKTQDSQMNPYWLKKNVSTFRFTQFFIAIRFVFVRWFYSMHMIGCQECSMLLMHSKEHTLNKRWSNEIKWPSEAIDIVAERVTIRRHDWRSQKSEQFFS